MGVVYLVGAGPGARGLVTVRAAALLASAAHVLFDPAVGAEVLALAPDAVKTPASASPAGAADQAAQLADGAGTVVRLLAGDGVTSKGAGEEMRRLQGRGVAWEVVPGLPPETAALAYSGLVGAGIEVAVRLEREAAAGPVLAIQAAPDAAGAAARLESGGLPGEAAALVVSTAGTPAQTVRSGSLAELAVAAAERGIAEAGQGAVLLAGRGVASRVPWFESKPLFGRRIVVTRPRAQSSEFLAWLEAQGAEAVEFPAIRIVPPPDPEPLRRAAADVASYDWLVFTSVNGVERFWAALQGAGLDTRALGGARVAAIGPATAGALRARGIVADVVPERYVAESVLEALETAGMLQGRRILLARAANAREVLPRRLKSLGALVTEVEAYRSVADAERAEDLRRRLTAGEIDAVTFTSSSTVQNFVDAVGTELGGAVVACIGPVTATTARDVGLQVAVVAPDHTVPGLQSALLAYFTKVR